MMAGELMALGFDAVNIPYARRRVVWGLRLVAFWSWAWTTLALAAVFPRA